MKKIYIAYEDGYPFKAGYAIDGWNEEKQEYSVLTSHASSDEGWVMSDLGMCPGSDNYIGKKNREVYDKAYPEGYELVWFGLIGSFADEVRLRNLLTEGEENGETYRTTNRTL